MATVKLSAVLWGIGLGALGLALSALALWVILSAFGVEDPVGVATTFGTLLGFATSGFVSGRRAPTSRFFHGALSALGLALAVVVTSVRGGSPAPTGQVLLLAALAILLGGLAATR